MSYGTCGKWRKITMKFEISLLVPAMPVIERVSELFSYVPMYSNFMFLDQFLFELSCKHTHTHTHIRTHIKTDEYCTVAYNYVYE